MMIAIVDLGYGPNETLTGRNLLPTLKRRFGNDIEVYPNAEGQDVVYARYPARGPLQQLAKVVEVR